MSEVAEGRHKGVSTNALPQQIQIFYRDTSIKRPHSLIGVREDYNNLCRKGKGGVPDGNLRVSVWKMQYSFGIGGGVPGNTLDAFST